MTGKEVYKIYAPSGAKWVDWVRPVPFVAIDLYNRKKLTSWQNKKLIFPDKYQKDTAIFVDLPGNESIELGIEFARLGYRPIPLFNGTVEQQGSETIIDTDLIECNLINGAENLKNIALGNSANPAFLLDSLRTNRYRAKESIFDNSWDLYAQDIPTAEYFKQNGINKILVIGECVQRDLRKIFFKFQKAGIEFYLTDRYYTAKKIELNKTLKEIFEKEEL